MSVPANKLRYIISVPANKLQILTNLIKYRN